MNHSEAILHRIANGELGRPSAEEFAAMEKMPVTVVLDKVRSTQNAGALFRTGDAFAVDQIFCAASPPLRSAVTSTKRLWGQDDRCCGAVCPRREGVRFPQRERTVLIRHAVKQKAAPEGGAQLFFVVYGFYRRITISSVSVV